MIRGVGVKARQSRLVAAKRVHAMTRPLHQRVNRGNVGIALTSHSSQIEIEINSDRGTAGNSTAGDRLETLGSTGSVERRPAALARLD
jgi:hypothetical protein